MRAEKLTELKNESSLYAFVQACLEQNKEHMLRSDLNKYLLDFMATDPGRQLKETLVEEIFLHSEEAVCREGWLYLVVRLRSGEWTFLRLSAEHEFLEEIDVSEFLQFKEGSDDARELLELDFKPFERGFPKLSESFSIGNGVQFLNRYLSKDLSGAEGQAKLLEFLQMHQYHGVQLLLNKTIDTVEELRDALRQTRIYLNSLPADTEWLDLLPNMPRDCFEPGWGRTASQISDMMGILLKIFQAPAPRQLEDFLSRIPMISRLAIMSPHGYFGQQNVLGLPDTGGQVVYILDQVRALEKEMFHHLHEQGVDAKPEIVIITRLIPEAEGTTCNQRLERVEGTENAVILRVPFRDKNGEVVPHWISRFNVWPYLEQFSRETEKELLAHLKSKPDIVIGNYSDGNMVGALLAHRLKITQCNIAHALEKTKYLYSALYWQDFEEEYHFSCQFTADLIAMNMADFIVTSTYQEIAGTESGVGQYESYSSFTMPDLYRVIQGVDIFDPKFNIVSPGADPQAYFSHRKKESRLTKLHADIEAIIFGEPGDGSRGKLLDRKKPLLFAMSRLDSIKNVSGLVEWYGSSSELQKEANLFIVAGKVDPGTSSDSEEKNQSLKVHELMDKYDLDGSVRWVNAISDKRFNGEVYRYIADMRGAFVQPAQFEAFGLTVIEAMSSGLPVFATCYGGPLEIIEDGKSGMHINPNQGSENARQMVRFFEKCRKDPSYWDELSQGSLDRIAASYTWSLYAKRLLSLSRIYGFWKHISHIERQETSRYLEMFYELMYKSRAATLTE